MSELWDKRYSDPEYAYGKEPNKYFKQIIDKLIPGKLLLPGEGEGRNKDCRFMKVDITQELRRLLEYTQ